MAQRASLHGKALLVQSAYAPARPRTHQALRRAGVPVYGSVETAARALSALAERGRFLATARERAGFHSSARRPLAGATRVLTEPAGRALLERHGLSTGPWVFAQDADATARAVAELGAPAAVKIVSPDVSHKSDAGGVALDVRGPHDARETHDRVFRAVRDSCPGAHLEGVLVTPMAPGGVELIVGASTDPTFGTVLAVGAGGTAVELVDDVTFRAVPVTALECEEMLDELACAPLLDGFRGSGAVDRSLLTELLLTVSKVLEAEPEVVELDLNPVFAHPSGLVLADVRVVVAEGSALRGTRAQPDTPVPATRSDATAMGTALRSRT